MNHRQNKIAALCDGKRSSKEIATILQDSAKYVQRTMLKFDLPRKSQGAQKGPENPSWKQGRSIDLDGYASVPAQENHSSRKVGRIAEHRLIMEKKIGRKLLAKEVVDHIDGLHLHNDPSNLRLFSSNAEHLKATIKGQIPSWSKDGIDRMNSTFDQRKESQRVDTYRRRKVSGDVRLQQILLAALQLGIDSPYLLGTHHHLEKAGIDPYSHQDLERALDDLYRKYA